MSRSGEMPFEGRQGHDGGAGAPGESEGSSPRMSPEWEIEPYTVEPVRPDQDAEEPASETGAGPSGATRYEAAPDPEPEDSETAGFEWPIDP